VCVPLDRYRDEWTPSENGSSMFGDRPTEGAVMRLLIVDEAFRSRRSNNPPINERLVTPTKTEYVQGSPGWIDLQTTDQSAREGKGT
jgi:hypothetical protein